MTTAQASPPRGGYLTDGKRLCEFIGVDDDGNYHLEDCAANVGDERPEASVLISADELVREWKVVVAAD